MTDTLIERLRAQDDAMMYPDGTGGPMWTDSFRELFREAAAALDRAERVVEAARESGFHSCPPTGNSICSICVALRAYDMAGKEPFRVESRTTLRREAIQRGEEPPQFDADKGREQFTTCRGCGATALLPDAPELCSSCKQNQHVRGLKAEGEKK